MTLKLTTSFGGAVSNRIDKYLHNFKRLVENAEIENSKLYPEGESTDHLPSSSKKSRSRAVEGE